MKEKNIKAINAEEIEEWRKKEIIMPIKECKHEFHIHTKKFQEMYSNYDTKNNYKYAILDKERAFIFCIHCGKTKEIN